MGAERRIIEPRIMQVLVALARRRGEVVSRSELIDACWGGRIVGEDAINRGIAGVRRLSEASGAFQIETVPRVGYRLDDRGASGPASLPMTVRSEPAPDTLTTILLVEVIGHPRFAEADGTAPRARLSEVQGRLTRLAAEYAGRLEASRGDGATILFAAPGIAMTCALAFERQLADLRLGMAADEAIHCRMAIHVGVVIDADGRATGEAAEVAARIKVLAEPSSILVSDAARVAARPCPPMEALGFHLLEGFATPVRLWRLTAAPQAWLGGDLEVEGLEPPSDDLGGGRPTVAVLPFEHATEDREQTYLAEGVAEDVIAALSRFKWLFVLSRHSALNYKKPSHDLVQINRDLGVRYIVTGRLVCQEGRLRLAVSLTDCVRRDVVWSRRFEGPMSDIFQIQDEITATLVGALEPAVLHREEARAARPAPRSLRHWDLFIRGRWHFWQLTYGHVAKARVILTQALAVRPDDAPTLSLLAYTHFTRLWSGWTDDADAELRQARRLAMRAVRLDPDDAFAHYTFGIALTLTAELDRAMAEQKRALQLNPNFAAAIAEIGRYLAFSGEYRGAIAHLDRAIRISPGDAHYFLWFRDKAIAAFTASRLDEAVAFASQSIALRPDIFFNHYLLAAIWAEREDLERARGCFDEGRRLLPRYPLRNLKFGHPFVRQTDLDRFVGALRRCGWDD